MGENILLKKEKDLFEKINKRIRPSPFIPSTTTKKREKHPLEFHKSNMTQIPMQNENEIIIYLLRKDKKGIKDSFLHNYFGLEMLSKDF